MSLFRVASATCPNLVRRLFQLSTKKQISGAGLRESSIRNDVVARNRHLRDLLLSLTILLGIPAAARADDESETPAPLPQIIVTATRVPTPEDEVASSVTVITSDDIERLQERNLPDMLQLVPGLNVDQTGGPGGVSEVFIRGANNNHTKVLLDGIDVSDPSSANGAVDLGAQHETSRGGPIRGTGGFLYRCPAAGDRIVKSSARVRQNQTRTSGCEARKRSPFAGDHPTPQRGRRNL